MRIALVHPFGWPEVRRGGERYLDGLSRYLREHGHDVDTITGTAGRSVTTSGQHGHDRRLRNLRNVHRSSIQLAERETFGLRATPTLLRHRYDVVHCLVPAAAVAAKAAGQRTILTLLGHPTRELLRERPAQRRLLRLAIRLTNSVTVLSTVVADDIESAFGQRPVVVPPGVRLTDFAPLSRTPEPSILFASALRPEKGVDTLLKAFGVLAPARPGLRLVLSGPGDPSWAFSAAGPDIEPVRERIDVVGVGDPADLPSRYAGAHVTVLPSRDEAFGLVLAESLASGTPVVGTIGGGANDIVTPDVGRVVPHGDVDALVRALDATLELAADPHTAARCAARASTWDWDSRIGPLHESVYRTALR